MPKSLKMEIQMVRTLSDMMHVPLRLCADCFAEHAGWIFPTDAMEISGPSFIILPSDPPTCLAVSLETACIVVLCLSG